MGDVLLEMLPLSAQPIALHPRAGLPCLAEWARDIPSEAFGPNYADVVTAPSATHLYCMRRLQRRGVLKSTAEVTGQ